MIKITIILLLSCLNLKLIQQVGSFQINLSFLPGGLKEVTLCVGQYVQLSCNHSPISVDPDWISSKRRYLINLDNTNDQKYYRSVLRSEDAHIIEVGPVPASFNGTTFWCRYLGNDPINPQKSNSVNLSVIQVCTSVASRQVSLYIPLESSTYSTVLMDGKQANKPVNHQHFKDNIFTLSLAVCGVTLLVIAMATILPAGIFLKRRRSKKKQRNKISTDQKDGQPSVLLQENPAYGMVNFKTS